MCQWLLIGVGALLSVIVLGIINEWMEQRHERKMAEIHSSFEGEENNDWD